MSSSFDGQVLFWETRHGMPNQASYSDQQAKDFLRARTLEAGLEWDFDVEVNGKNEYYGSHEGALVPASQAFSDEHMQLDHLFQQNRFDVAAPFGRQPTATEELPPMLSEVAKFLDETTFLSDRTCAAFIGMPPPRRRSVEALASAVAQRLGAESSVPETAVVSVDTEGERSIAEVAQSKTDVDVALVSAYEMISDMKNELSAAYEVISERDEALAAAQTTLLEKDEELKVASQGNHEAQPENQSRRSFMFWKRSKQQNNGNKPR